jgi:hypothetical protein
MLIRLATTLNGVIASGNETHTWPSLRMSSILGIFLIWNARSLQAVSKCFWKGSKMSFPISTSTQSADVSQDDSHY